MSQHVLSLKAHVAVFAVLLVLTFVTVWVADHDLGRWNTIVALAIAATKGMVVILWFMHVKFSSNLTRLFVAAGFLWLALMVLLMTSDYATRQVLDRWM